MFIPLYPSETWTLPVSDNKRLEAFHMCCLRRLLNITWQDRITNEAILATTGLTVLQDMSKQRASLFGHVDRLNPCSYTPSPIDADGLSTGWKPDVRQRLTNGRPRKTWCYTDLD